MKTCLGVFAVLAVLLMLLVGGTFFYFSKSLHEVEVAETAAHVDGSGIDVETKNGGVKVTRGDGGEIEVKATFRVASEERLAECQVRLERRPDGMLEIRPVWPDGKKKLREGCSIAVAVPDGISGIKVRSSNGRVDVSGLGGEADIATSNGRVEVRDHRGPVDVETSNGQITVIGATGKVDALSSNGKISVTMAPDSDAPVNLRTSNGSVTLALGKGFSGQLAMATSNGKIDHGGASGATVLESDRRKVKLKFGDADTVSTVQTSNGSIEVSKPSGTLPAEAPEPAATN